MSLGEESEDGENGENGEDYDYVKNRLGRELNQIKEQSLDCLSLHRDSL
jgi:hypothetical protein